MRKSILLGHVRHYSTIVPSLAFVCVWGGLLPYKLIDDMSPGVFAWWNVLCAVSGFNIWAWRLSAGKLAYSEPHSDPSTIDFRRWQHVLCTAFVLGCAF